MRTLIFCILFLFFPLRPHRGGFFLCFCENKFPNDKCMVYLCSIIHEKSRKMTFQTIPTIEEARENQVARLLWSASKKMVLYQNATGEFSANDLFSGAITVDYPSELIENCKILGIEVLVERADYSGFDKL